YRNGSPDHHADERFSRDLADILHERPAIDVDVGGSESAAEEITPRMREVRSQVVEVRKAVYLRDRIQDQRTWYGQRARANARASSRWLVPPARRRRPAPVPPSPR